MLKMTHVLCPLLVLLMVASLAGAGGVAPDEEGYQEQAVREKVTATPAQTSTAVSKARQAAPPSVTPTTKSAPVRATAPKVKQVPRPAAKAKAAAATDQNSWLISSREGECVPLSSVSQKVKNTGKFKTPQEFARNMQQRGYQAFALDIGDARDQVVRVKVPDMDLDLTFMRAGMCR